MEMANNLYGQFQRNRVIINSPGDENQNENNGSAWSASRNAGYQKYQNNMINTASPQELTLMLYNGLVKFLNLSIQGIEENSMEKASNNIIRAQDIIQEFIATLDMKYEVSGRLLALYDYMNSRLIDANIKKDKVILEEVRSFAEELRDTWSQAMKTVKQQMVTNR